MFRVRTITTVSLAAAGLFWLASAMTAQQQSAPPQDPPAQQTQPQQEAAPQQPAQPPTETAPAQQPATPPVQETAPAQQPATPPVQEAAPPQQTQPAQPETPPAQQTPVEAPPVPVPQQAAPPATPETPAAAAPQPAAAHTEAPAPPPTPAPAPAPPPQTGPPTGITGKWTVTVGKSLTLDSPLPIQRLSVANGDLADAVAVNPKEILINGKQPGETTVIIWQQGGPRLMYELAVRPSVLKLDAVRQQVARDFPEEDINITYDNDTAFVRGKVKDVVSADRVMAIVGTLGGKPVNLLRVEVPPTETQVLLHVRFANVNRSASRQLGVNFASGAFNQNTAVGTGGPISTDGGRGFSLGDAVNIFFFRPDINLLGEIKALESKNMLEMLAEPNVLAINNKEASFVAGGEFPFPMVQGGGSVGTVTLMWREYGVRLHFLPVITPRGSIRLQVAPEVSSLDYTNAVTIQGFTVPGISKRRVETEVELDSGQSFVIAGLLDKQMTESLSRIPGIGNIPLLGKLFQTKTVSKNNNELLIIVTPEVVRPIQAGQAVPELKYKVPFMSNNSDIPMRHPGIDKTGTAPGKPTTETIPLEQLIQQQKGQAAPAPTMGPIQLIPMPAGQAPPGPTTPGLTTPTSGPGGTVK